MPKNIEIKDLIKNKKLADDLINGITKSFADSVRKDVRETIESVKGAGVSIRDLKESDKWLGATLHAVFNATKFNSKVKETALRIVREDKSNEFVESFEDTVISIDYNRETKSGDDNTIETKITVTPSSAGPVGELIAEMMAAVYFGGEIKSSDITKIGDNEVYTLNATPGYNQGEIDKAADKLRDFFYKQHKEEIEEKFEDELKRLSKGL